MLDAIPSLTKLEEIPRTERQRNEVSKHILIKKQNKANTNTNTSAADEQKKIKTTMNAMIDNVANNVDVEVAANGSIFVVPRQPSDIEDEKGEFWTTCWKLPRSTQQPQHSTAEVRALNDNTTTTNDNPQTTRELCGATIAGGLLGCLCCGPCGGLVSASAAALAVSSQTEIGEYTREGGEVVAKVGDRIKEFDHDHQLLSKTKVAANNLEMRIRSYDEEHRVVEKTKVNVSKGYEHLKKRIEPNDFRTSQQHRDDCETSLVGGNPPSITSDATMPPPIVSAE